VNTALNDPWMEIDEAGDCSMFRTDPAPEVSVSVSVFFLRHLLV